ncbi:ABC transporter substrate-binding protein [Magnetospirillum fulvum]|uniref:NitT/TauT family transport system substrate-binding protein n=1 Tax=Magnetospirillum fulvum TaxID=1082 RepID=A0A1H6GU90_MAGFU|nr:ABC transporter substrate-binding protein [Magnetospirillum fulvum]SEH25423.1 NitT/TauT family transport system substrate-binding protein [Magnetospirillum fulvum]
MADISIPLSRRSVLIGAAAAGIAAPLGGGAFAQSVASTAELKPIRFAWNANAACLAPVALAKSSGLFKKHGLDVELINFAGSTDQLLETLATGKADAAVGMALRWIKPLEQGFDVKLVGGTHGGCLRLLGVQGTGVTEDITSLKGKTVGTPDLGGPDKNFFSLLAQKRGLDPVKDINWRQYPADLLPLAAEKGEIQALSHSDPLTWLFLKRYPNLFEVATNLNGEYANRLCCLVGVRGSLLRQDKPTAGRIYRALLDAQTLTNNEPRLAAEAFQPYSPKSSVEDLIAMLKTHTHGHSPVGTAFRQEIVLYAEELKQINVLKPTTDPQKYADRVYVDVLG